ncbi:hypothetical protein [Streptomyces arboris]|uniref:hypothetical protein n=1 Tax=Streptomyces arboris TaxID=2600619 RepID=UPI003BF5914A
MTLTKSRIFQATCSAVLAGALLAMTAPAATALPVDSRDTRTATGTPAGDVGAYLDPASQGYTYEEAVEAFKDSEIVTVVRGDIDEDAWGEGDTPRITPRGVSFGWYVYVKMSKSQAKAINAGSAATAAGIIGAITGGIGGAVAAGAYAYIVSLGNEGIDKCKKGVELKFSYTGRAKGGKCY